MESVLPNSADVYEKFGMNPLKRISALFLPQALLLEFQDLVTGILNNQGVLTQQMYLESTIKRMEPQEAVHMIGKYKIVHQEFHGLDTATAFRSGCN